MTKTEENKLDKLQSDLLKIENHAKNLDLKKNKSNRLILTDIVDIKPENKKGITNSEIKNNLDKIRIKLNEQLYLIENLIKKFS